MDEMMVAMDVADPQAIRSALTQLRQGRVADPSLPGTFLRRLPVRWNPGNRRYYDLSNTPSEAVAAQIPGSILTGAFAELLNRVSALDSSMGADGLARSAAMLLNDNDVRRLIEQLPLPIIWQVHATVLHIAQARQLLEIQQAGGGQALPPP